jgi:hypothetical protein
VENLLSGDVTIVNSATFYDGPTVSLTVGTWLVQGTVTISDATAAGNQTAKLWDGTTVYASGESMVPSVNGACAITLQAVIVVPSTISYKISCASSHGTSNAKIRAATPSSGSGNNASRLSAIKIA